MTITYDQLVSSLTNLLQVDNSGDFANILPEIVDDAEQRIYREVNFLAERDEDTSIITTSGVRTINLSSTALPCVTVEQFALQVAGASSSDPVTIVPFQGPVSLDFINMVWPQRTVTRTPSLYTSCYWGMQDDQTVVLGPTPDASYTAVVTGVFRPLAMGPSNQTTYLGQFYPDLLLSACMVFSAAWQRDFGAESEDPRVGLSWEKHYQDEKQSAMEEEARRRGESTGWTPMKQYVATPPRT